MPPAGRILRAKGVRMDIDQFYEQDPRRQTSDEVEFGREWSEHGVQFEVAWVADTGEVFAMAEPVSRRAITTESVTVEILAVIEQRDGVETALAGWQDAMSQPDSLEWVRGRVTAGPAA